MNFMRAKLTFFPKCSLNTEINSLPLWLTMGFCHGLREVSLKIYYICNDI